MKKNLVFMNFIAVVFMASCSKIGGKPSTTNVFEEEILPTSPYQSIAISASGEGTLLLEHLNGIEQHFSFNVRKYSNGNVMGVWESKSPGQDLRTHGILNCINFLDQNTAYITGIITQKIGSGFPGEYEPGMPIWFRIKDMGEGNNSEPDQFTDYYSIPGIECINYSQASMHSITSGNIKIISNNQPNH